MSDPDDPEPDELADLVEPLLEVAERLYAGLPGDFMVGRDAAVREHRGDKVLVARIKQLRRPVAAAWLLNVLTRYESDQLTQVLDLGEALRTAQDQLVGEDLRALTRQRRQLTAAVASSARGLAVRLGHPVSGGVADQVEAALTAAMTDEGCATALRSGLLVAVPWSDGLSGSDPAEVVAVPEAVGRLAPSMPAPRTALRSVETGHDARREAAEQAVEEAAERLAETEEEVTSAEADRDHVGARSLQAASEADELRRRLEDLDDEAARLAEELEELDDRLASARLEHEAARTAYADAQRELDGGPDGPGPADCRACATTRGVTRVAWIVPTSAVRRRAREERGCASEC